MPDLDIIKLLEDRVFGLRAIEEIDFGLLDEPDDLPPVVVLRSGRVQIVLIPTVDDDLIDFEVHAFGDGMKFDHDVHAYTVRLQT